MHGSFWSLMPFLIVIPISIVTRQVLPGLMVGLLVGSYMIHPTLLGGIDGALLYILKELAIPDNLRLIVFLYGFGAFVGLVRVTGGVTGFAQWMEKRVKTVRGAFALTWLSSLATFMAPDFRIITVAPVVRHVFDRLKVPTSRVALVIDLTSTPLTALVPLGTVFVGYMVGLLTTAGRHHGLVGTPYHLLLVSLPFNFFSLLMMAYGLYGTFFARSKTESKVTSTRKIRLTPESRLRIASQVGMEASEELSPRFRQLGQAAGTGPADAIPEPSTYGGATHLRPDTAAADLDGSGLQRQDGQPSQPHNRRSEESDVLPDAMDVAAEQTKPNPLNLLLPLALLLVLTLFLTWWSGHSGTSSVWQALVKANAARAMLQALLITLIVSIVWYSVQRLSIGRTMFGFLAGGNEMMGVIALLTLVWAVSAVSSDLGFTTYTEHVIGGLVPAAWIAPVLFLFGCAISYVIGSSFGTWGILMPIGFSLAASTHASMALIAGAIFASGTFGGFASPLSDNTVAMATVMKLPVMQYARYKLKPALFVAGGSTLLYAVAGWL